MRRLRSAYSRLSAPRSSSSLSRRPSQPGAAHHPRSSAPFDAAAQGEPELRAAFSRAACQHLAVLSLIVGGVRCTRKQFSALRNDAPRLDLSHFPIGTVILSYNPKDCKSFLRHAAIVAEIGPERAFCCALLFHRLLLRRDQVPISAGRSRSARQIANTASMTCCDTCSHHSAARDVGKAGGHPATVPPLPAAARPVTVRSRLPARRCGRASPRPRSQFRLGCSAR